MLDRAWRVVVQRPCAAQAASRKLLPQDSDTYLAMSSIKIVYEFGMSSHECTEGSIIVLGLESLEELDELRRNCLRTFPARQGIEPGRHLRSAGGVGLVVLDHHGVLARSQRVRVASAGQSGHPKNTVSEIWFQKQKVITY